MKDKVWKILDNKIEVGSKLETILHPYDDNYEIYSTIVNGSNPGKTIVLSSGIHSGEYPGVAACSLVANEIDPAKVNGRIIFLHSINSSGFWQKRERYIPEDGGNLNDIFPGDKQGTISQKIAAFLENEIMKEADFIMDFHSGGGEEDLQPCLFFPTTASEEVNKISLEVAKATTIPHLIASKAKTGFYSYATTKGIPAILLERGRYNLCEREDYEAYIEDIYAVLGYFNVINKTKKSQASDKIIWNKTEYINSNHQGLWYTDLKAGMMIKKGDLIGTVRDLFGNVLAEYRVAEDSRVMYIHTGLMIKKGSSIGAFGVLKDTQIVQ